jgi:hypothetical protein
VANDTEETIVVRIASPIRDSRRRATPRRGNYLRPDDSLWDIVGMDKTTDRPRDVAENKHTYLSKAYLHNRD